MRTPPFMVMRLRSEALWGRARSDALDLAGAAVRHWVPPGDSREQLDRALAVRRRPEARRMAPALAMFGKLRPTAFFVQIGASDAVERQPLRDAIERSRWPGLVVEPIPAALEHLRRRYPHLPADAFERAAIASEDGERPFYHLVPGSAGERARDAPAPGSLRREALLFHRRFRADVEDEVVEVPTPCLTVASLFSRHGIESFDVLQVDTEGYDQEILDQIDLERFGPALVVYQSGRLIPRARTACAERLRSLGYDTIEHEGDTWCLRTTALARSDAALLQAIWRWTADRYMPGHPLRPTALVRAIARHAVRGPGRNGEGPSEAFGLTDSERRYLRTGYDDRVPLPPGAASFLSADNPRLGELRRAYDALDLPAVQHHMWRPARVAEVVDLRYFRGDNLYQWHYPEHPRTMALALFIYMRYVESRGGRPLLDLLSEDGCFGCWTAEVSGYGKVSRDLLDSVNEILFLDRQLGVLDATGPRMIDVGAGYGRLAHRMTAALPSLADYCCVDAVAESTFLSEYYLRFRGCSPPARVVPLTAFETSLEPGSFDLALNIHSFSECTLAAIEWWAGQLARLRVPHLFVVPNEPEGIVSREPDGDYHDAMPTLEAAGYRPIACERVVADPAVRELVRINDNFYLFALSA